MSTPYFAKNKFFAAVDAKKAGGKGKKSTCHTKEKEQKKKLHEQNTIIYDI